MRARWWLGAVVIVAIACGGDDEGEGANPKAGPPGPGGTSGTNGGSVDASPDGTTFPVPPGGRPNIIFVIADDQRHDSVACMPNLKELFANGVTFANSFASTPLCCPGRTTVLTGRYAHAHGVRTNGDEEEGDVTSTPGAKDFNQNGNDELVFAKWLQAAGYRTGFYGKYLNGYEDLLADANEKNDVPPYWDSWHAYSKPTFYDFQLVERDDTAKKPERICYLSSRGNDTGATACRRGATRTVNDGAESHATDVLAAKASEFVTKAAADGVPFFLYFAPKAPHGPFQSPSRYQPAMDKTEFTPLAMERLGQCPLFEWTEKPASYLLNDPTLSAAMPQWVKDQVGKRNANVLDDNRKRQLVSVLANEDALATLLNALEKVGKRAQTVISAQIAPSRECDHHRVTEMRRLVSRPMSLRRLLRSNVVSSDRTRSTGPFAGCEATHDGSRCGTCRDDARRCRISAGAAMGSRCGTCRDDARRCRISAGAAMGSTRGGRPRV